MPYLSRRQFLRGAMLATSTIATAAVVAACGHPESQPAGAMPLAASPPAPGTPAATMGPGGPATPGWVPTPVPTPDAPLDLPSALREPTPSSKPTPRPDQLPTPPPPPPADAPFQLIVHGAAAPNLRGAVTDSALIVLGTVGQILSARWSTPGGQRPPNPWAARGNDTIFTPVLVAVEQYLKGVQPQRELLLFAPGGASGQDKVTYDGPYNYTFRAGERVVVFVDERVPGSGGRLLDGRPLWHLVGKHYTVGADGSATDNFRTLPLQQLLTEIAAAQQP